MKRAVVYFEQAIRLDPRYALAYVGLADAYTSLATYYLVTPEHAWPRAREAATKALAIDQALAEPHASLGFIALNFEWDWRAAEREFRRAVEIDSRYHPARLWYAHYFLMMGRFDEAIAEFKRAEEIDPLSLIGNTNYGLALALKGQHEHALEQYRKAIELEPRFSMAHCYMGEIYLWKGLYAEAIAHYQRANQLSPGWWSDYLGHAYARIGKRDEALRILHELRRIAIRRPMSIRVARVLAGLGDDTEAIRWLERGYANRESGLIGLKIDPIFSKLHGNPRFRRLLRRMEFE
jgi:tetratricopeptide (TPR) repeat protein